MDKETFVVVVSGLAVLLPVAGLTVRLALKPVVDSIVRLMELRASANSSDLMERRITLLEQEMQVIRAENNRLQDERDFYSQLESHNRH